jgi:hypothetical protein
VVEIVADCLIRTFGQIMLAIAVVIALIPLRIRIVKPHRRWRRLFN